jgi:hypothetical protein
MRKRYAIFSKAGSSHARILAFKFATFATHPCLTKIERGVPASFDQWPRPGLIPSRPGLAFVCYLTHEISIEVTLVSVQVAHVSSDVTSIIVNVLTISRDLCGACAVANVVSQIPSILCQIPEIVMKVATIVPNVRAVCPNVSTESHRINIRRGADQKQRTSN